jgi:hypothetical protein
LFDSRNRENPAFKAALSADIPYINILIKIGVLVRIGTDVFLRDLNGRTPLHHAVASGAITLDAENPQKWYLSVQATAEHLAMHGALAELQQSNDDTMLKDHISAYFYSRYSLHTPLITWLTKTGCNPPWEMRHPPERWMAQDHVKSRVAEVYNAIQQGIIPRRCEAMNVLRFHLPVEIVTLVRDYM